MQTLHSQHTTEIDLSRLISLAVWSALGLIAVVLISRSAAGAFTRPLTPIIPGLIGAAALALALAAWWWDDRLRRDANAYDRSVRGLMALLPALAIGITTSGGASAAIGVLLGLGLISAAAVLAVSWELDPRLALPRSQQPADNLPRPLWGERVGVRGAERIEAPDGLEPVADPVIPAQERVACGPDSAADPQPDSAFSDPGVSQHITRRNTPDGLDCLEALLRISFSAGEREAIVHLPLHPPLAGPPEVECEPLDDADLTFKVTTAQPYGVRIEVRRGSGYDEACTFAVGVALHARQAAEAAA
jgi:hypothetical protein